MTSYVSKLITLTNEMMKADGNMTAKQVRDNLVNDIFPLLDAEERAEISEKTELDDVLRTIEQDFGHFLCHDGIRNAAEDAVRHFRHSEQLQQHENEMAQSSKGLTYLHRLVMLTNADLIDIAGDKAYEKRRAIVDEVFPLLNYQDKKEIADATELNDVRRVLKGAFPNWREKALHTIADQTVQCMKLAYLNQKIAKSRIASMSSDDDMDWEPL